MPESPSRTIPPHRLRAEKRRKWRLPRATPRDPASARAHHSEQASGVVAFPLIAQPAFSARPALGGDIRRSRSRMSLDAPRRIGTPGVQFPRPNLPTHPLSALRHHSLTKRTFCPVSCSRSSPTADVAWVPVSERPRHPMRPRSALGKTARNQFRGWGPFEERVRLRDGARGVLRDRAAWCGRVIQFGGRGSGGEAQRVMCGSAVCPVCGPRVWAAHREWVARLLLDWERRGGQVLLLTLTVPHRRAEGLSDLLDVLEALWGRMASGRPWRRFLRDFEISRWVRFLEVEDGRSGWHPHFHLLVLLPARRPVGAVRRLVEAVEDRWVLRCVEAGRPVQSGGYAVDGRLLANSWLGIPAYVTKGPGRLVADLAERAGRGDRAARARWRELQAALTGRTRVSKSSLLVTQDARSSGGSTPIRGRASSPIWRYRNLPGWKVQPRCRSPCPGWCWSTQQVLSETGFGYGRHRPGPTCPHVP